MIPHIDSNTFNNIFYLPFVREALRKTCSTLHFSGFILEVRELGATICSFWELTPSPITLVTIIMY